MDLVVVTSSFPNFLIWVLWTLMIEVMGLSMRSLTSCIFLSGLDGDSIQPLQLRLVWIWCALLTQMNILCIFFSNFLNKSCMLKINKQKVVSTVEDGSTWERDSFLVSQREMPFLPSSSSSFVHLICSD
jgi:hypothetical protein